MSQIVNKQFEDTYGYTHIVTSEIDRGGQGAVFRTQDPDIAIKVKFNSGCTEYNKDLSENKTIEAMRLLPVHSKINLTMPLATLKDYAGYVMRLLDDMESFEQAFDFSFQNDNLYLNDWLKGFADSSPDFVNVLGQYITTGGRRRRLTAYFKIACMLASLHTRGLVYGDFSAKNAYISSAGNSDMVWLIDADNLMYQENAIIAGYYTPGYGAPEVIQGKGCTFYSDAYAFAISLFWQLTGTHPFMGALTEEDSGEDFADEAEENAYAGDFPWIFDEDDESNSTQTQIPQAKEMIISERLGRVFSRTFSNMGKEKRHTRPTMLEWGYALARELDSTVKCSYCEMDYDESFDVCPWCDTQNHRLILASEEQNRSIWKIVHEVIPDMELSIPMRLIKGFCGSEYEINAFLIKRTKDGFILMNLYDGYEWSISTDNCESFDSVYGNVIIPEKCVVRCIDRLSKRTILIEVACI
jgi:serine/threonine protein kinase